MTAQAGDNLTLAEHAEAWWKEQGKEVPPAHTRTWTDMYEKWIEFAFSEFKYITGR